MFGHVTAQDSYQLSRKPIFVNVTSILVDFIGRSDKNLKL